MRLRLPGAPSAICRIRAVWVLTFVGFVVAGAFAPAAPGVTDRCASAGSRTVASSDKVRVFSKRRASSAMVNYVGCVRSNGRRTRLGPTVDADGTLHSVSRFRVAGSLVAYQRTDAGVGGSAFWAGRIVVRDLTARGAPRRVTAGAVRGMAYAEHERGDGVRDLVIDVAGDLAWIIQNPNALPDPPPGNYRDTRTTEVYLARRDGAPILLDQGEAIVHNSLSRKGCTISWTHGATRRTARLCP